MINSGYAENQNYEDEYPETLSEVTGQKSGIVIYPGTNENDYCEQVIVCNWAEAAPKSFPKILIDGSRPDLIWFPEEGDGFRLTERYEVDDITTVFEGCVYYDEEKDFITCKDMAIVYDYFLDMPYVFGIDVPGHPKVVRDELGKPVPIQGTVYVFDEVIVIAPENWE